VSLKTFHIVLISLSSLLALGFGAWAWLRWSDGDGGAFLATAIVSVVVALGLDVYVVWFARKVRSREEEERRRRKMIHPLAVALVLGIFAARDAGACAVCYGEAEGSMIDAARLGVWLLFGLVLALQAAFVVFFLYLRRRAARYRDKHPLPGGAA
jgi:hypothetical protein